MQDRYVGDVGDFANNGLLRWLTGMNGPHLVDEEKLRLGVVQFNHLNEPSYGGHIGYLSRTPENLEEFRKCDTVLYDIMQDLVFRGNRTIVGSQKSFKRRRILPHDTIFYDKVLTFGNSRNAKQNKAIRASWLDRAANSMRDAKIIFFNPDNGVANQESPTSSKGTKYVFVNELDRFAKCGKSLVVYHHLGRTNHGLKIHSVARELACCLQLPVWSFRYSAWSSRAYFIVLQRQHAPKVVSRLTYFLQSDWCKGTRNNFNFRFAFSAVPCDC